MMRYTSDNGYTGIVYGNSSFTIQDRDGKEVLHTSRRTFDSYDELVRQVNEFPEFMNIVQSSTYQTGKSKIKRS